MLHFAATCTRACLVLVLVPRFACTRVALVPCHHQPTAHFAVFSQEDGDWSDEEGEDGEEGDEGKTRGHNSKGPRSGSGGVPTVDIPPAPAKPPPPPPATWSAAADAAAEAAAARAAAAEEGRGAEKKATADKTKPKSQARDRKRKRVMVVIRGTNSLQDVVTDIRTVPIPFPPQNPEGRTWGGVPRSTSGSPASASRSRSRSTSDGEDWDDDMPSTTAVEGMAKVHQSCAMLTISCHHHHHPPLPLTQLLIHQPLSLCRQQCG